MPRWLFGARDTCESCKSLDVRHLHRRGRLFAAWTCAGEPSGSIRVRTEPDALILSYCTRHFPGEVKDTEQRVPITWTACHFGGRRHMLRHSTGYVTSIGIEHFGADLCQQIVSTLALSGLLLWEPRPSADRNMALRSTLPPTGRCSRSAALPDEAVGGPQ
jgi:hypothetical protein